MKNRIFVRILANLLVLALLIGGFSWIVGNGEIWYPVLASKLTKEPFVPMRAEVGGTTSYTLDELKRMSGMTIDHLALLVNAEHPLSSDFVPSLAEYNGARMHPQMVDAYIALRDDVQARTGVRIYVSSDYRTPEEQEEILREEGSDIAAGVGCSEHEAGLALDVYAPYCGGMSFLRSPAGRMVNNVCGAYGFIIRYPYQKENVTGISYEPWHLRYVGQPHASLIMQHGLTYEEYLDALSPNTWYQSGEYLIARLSPDALALPDGWQTCEISSDNTGHLLVTLQMS